MPRPLLRFAQVILVFAVFCMVNGPDFIAQGFAWGTMIIDYSTRDTVVEAVLKTFDGSHPCKICKRVDEQQGGETKRMIETSLRKLHLCCVSTDDFDLGGLVSTTFPSLVVTTVSGNLEPPFLPPRVA